MPSFFFRTRIAACYQFCTEPRALLKIVPGLAHVYHTVVAGSVGQASDGQADDGLIDPSTAECAECLWAKRIKPYLFDRGITTFWLDDDELDKFDPRRALPPLPSPQLAPPHAPRFRCGPREYCGMWLAGKAWPQAFARGIESEGGLEAASPLILSRNACVRRPERGKAPFTRARPSARLIRDSHERKRPCAGGRALLHTALRCGRATYHAAGTS